MKRDYRDFLEDILSSIDETQSFTEGVSFTDFTADRKTVNAVLRSLEVIGEAAKNLPDGVRSRAPEVPWKYMAGMRDKLAHEYFGVDLRIVWTVVKEELPDLRPKIEKLANDSENPEG